MRFLASQSDATAADLSVSQRSEDRRRRFDDVPRLHAEGLPILPIAHQTGLARSTVRSYLRAGTFVPYRRAPGPNLPGRHRGLAEARWHEGLRSGSALHRGLRRRCRYRSMLDRSTAGDRTGPLPLASHALDAPDHAPLASNPIKLAHEERTFIDALYEAAPGVGITASYVRTFADLLRQDDPPGLEPWLDAAAATGSCGFAAGLRQDKDALRAASTHSWCNGAVEDQVIGRRETD